MTDNTVMFEARVGKSSVLSDLTLREIKWPPNTLVVSVNRSGETIFPRADTKLQEDDRVMVMAEPGSEQALRTFLEGTQHHARIATVLLATAARVLYNCQ